MLRIEVAGGRELPVPRELAWECLLDSAALRACIPGCESFVAIGPDAYAIRAKVGVGFLRGTFAGTVSIPEQRPQEWYRLAIVARGRPGQVQGDAEITLSVGGDATLLEYRSELAVDGALARLGRGALVRSARLSIGQFLAAMEREALAR